MFFSACGMHDGGSNQRSYRHELFNVASGLLYRAQDYTTTFAVFDN